VAITDVNPFVYSRPIPPDEVIDRDDETAALLQAVVGGHYVRLYAPRKYGKTSLLRRVLREAERSEGMTTVLVDLYGVLSLADVAVRIERAYAAQLRGGLRARIDEFLQRTGLGLSLSALGIGVRLQIDPRTDPLPALHALLDLPLKLEQEGGYRALVVFDEFQDITKLPGIDAIVRSHIQHQGEVASYVFAGSEQGLMKQLFEEKERPLYGQAVPVRLGRLPSSDIAAYIVDRFKQTGRSAGEAVNPLVQTAAGHPQRAMLLAYRLWDVVEPQATATLGDWEDALSTTMVELRPEFEAHWQRFTQVEQKSLRAIVEGQGATLRTHVLARLDADKSSVSRALKRLESAGEVEAIDGRTVLVDPLFALWLERLSLGVPGGEG
jgi:uncharacterized protein